MNRGLAQYKIKEEGVSNISDDGIYFILNEASKEIYIILAKDGVKVKFTNEASFDEVKNILSN